MAQVFQTNVFQNNVFQVAAGPASYVLDTTVGTYTLSGSSSRQEKTSLLSSTAGSYTQTGVTATTYPRVKPSVTALTSGGSQTTGTSFSSASVSPTADRVIFVAVYSNCVTSGNNSAPTSVAISSLNFTNVANTIVETNWGHLSVWRATSVSPPTGAVNFTFPNSRDTVVWTVLEANAEFSGTNAANAVVQSATSGPTTSTTTLTNTLSSAFECAGNGAISFVGGAYASSSNPTFSPEAGWTELNDTEQDNGSGWTIALNSNFRDNNADTSHTHTSSVSMSSAGGIIIELRGKEVAAGAASYVLDTTTGTYALTGSSATQLKDSLLVDSVGSYSISGVTTSLVKSSVLVATQGSYSLTGSNGTLLRDGTLVANPAPYSLSGQISSLTKDSLVVTTAGSYSLTGFSADITYAPAVGNFVLDTQVGVYDLTGFDAGLEYTSIQTGGGNMNRLHLVERIRRDDEECMRLVIEAFNKLAA